MLLRHSFICRVLPADPWDANPSPQNVAQIRSATLSNLVCNFVEGVNQHTVFLVDFVEKKVEEEGVASQSLPIKVLISQQAIGAWYVG